MQSTSAVSARRERRFVHSVLGLLFTYHALAITLGTLVPYDCHLYAVVHPWFRSYLTWTGAKQTWNMFRTVPNYASYDVVLVAEDKHNLQREYGPVLPGLRPCNSADYRDNKLFSKLTTAGYKSVRDAYFDAARLEIEARTHTKVRALHLGFKAQRMHNLARMRKDGHVSYLELTESEKRHWN
jgi:hypothetical protein